jgi:cytoplasmic tRNA 2-thiolation protein 1
LKDLESIRPSAILDIIYAGENFHIQQSTAEKLPEQGFDLQSSTHLLGLCTRCGFISSNAICKACSLLETLNKGVAKVKIEMEDQPQNKVISMQKN